MSAMASQISIVVSIVYSAVCSGTDQSFMSLAHVGGISPVTDEFPAQRISNAHMSPFDDVIMYRPVYARY